MNTAEQFRNIKGKLVLYKFYIYIKKIILENEYIDK